MKKNPIKRLLGEQWAAVTLGCIALSLILAISQPAFMRPTNIMNILCQCSMYGIMAVGMTFVISTGDIDISVGMNSLFIMALMYRLYGKMPVWLIFVVALIAGAVVGLFNGFMTSVLNFPGMIATLASMSILRGAGYMLLDNSQKFVPAELCVIGTARVFGGVPLATVIMIVATIIGFLVLKFTRFGRYVLAVGGSKNSAMFTGINVVRVRIGTYVICGLCAALGGIVYAGRVGSIAPNSCLGYEFTVITAVVLGGTRMSGGKSSIVGSMIGCVFLYLVENAMTMLNISSYYQTFARALMMLAAIAIDTVTTIRHQRSIIHERRIRFLQQAK